MGRRTTTILRIVLEIKVEFILEIEAELIL